MNLTFNCLLVYYTPGGRRCHFRAVTTAIAADLALDVAERLLTKDKRRKVAWIDYMEAIEQ